LAVFKISGGWFKIGRRDSGDLIVAGADVSELVNLCAFAGERFDLSQAGGGNASFVRDGELFITASGWPLSDVKDAGGTCRLDQSALVETMRSLKGKQDKLDKAELERVASKCVAQCSKTPEVRPSIETLMHCLLGPFTLHTHPIAVTALLCRKNWRETIEKLFPDAICVGYETPGVRLALALMDKLDESKRANGSTKVFLENHGFIVSAGSDEEVIQITNEVVDKVGGHLGLNLSHYKLTNQLTNLIRSVSKESVCSYYCEDKILLDALKSNEDLIIERPSWPDQLVYCGSAGLRLSSFGDARAVKDFMEKYSHLPKVIIVDEHIFLVDRTIKNCRRLEEVLKAHVMMLENADMDDVQFLSNDEQEYLLNWEAEKARQRM
jgi:rhamnose utilization protein RhaD (predicted bifunctional aldolase and dehydrogenase)